MKCNHNWELITNEITSEGYKERPYVTLRAFFYCKKCLKIKGENVKAFYKEDD